MEICRSGSRNGDAWSSPSFCYWQQGSPVISTGYLRTCFSSDGHGQGKIFIGCWLWEIVFITNIPFNMGMLLKNVCWSGLRCTPVLPQPPSRRLPELNMLRPPARNQACRNQLVRMDGTTRLSAASDRTAIFLPRSTAPAKEHIVPNFRQVWFISGRRSRVLHVKETRLAGCLSLGKSLLPLDRLVWAKQVPGPLFPATLLPDGRSGYGLFNIVISGLSRRTRYSCSSL